ncbi:hypothetical protein [Paractinoplanes atraurantiacus]|uniref:hypothetical protein n=1 Tax=Paractinoplanes atraurantiacus TaxID=1036182 RepID=UPI001177E25A|nr:hypothetical protein [Actinoplanes atraurantiacus]
MGSDARIYVFDYERYRAEVVPGVLSLLRGGDVPPWLAGLPGSEWTDIWAPMAGRMRSRPVDLAAYCLWLGEDLAYLGNQLVMRPEGARQWLRCPSTTCPERSRCSFHAGAEQENVEELSFLYAAWVTLRCLGEGQFVGRSARPSAYDPLLEHLGVPGNDPIRLYLNALDVRGGVLGYEFENTGGTYGWLNPAETADLAARLDKLDLPRYERTFAAASAAFGAFHSGPSSELDWPALTLSFVRTVATIAATTGQGVLWGGDLYPESWRELLNL